MRNKSWMSIQTSGGKLAVTIRRKKGPDLAPWYYPSEESLIRLEILMEQLSGKYLTSFKLSPDGISQVMFHLNLPI